MTIFTRLREEPSVAYFSMEIAVDPDVPTYSGGLGVLAGDLVRSAADLGVPLVAITQLSRAGYFRQQLGADGTQQEQPVSWTPEERLERLPFTVEVQLWGRPVAVQPWRFDVVGARGHVVPVLMLDTDVASNAPADRAVTAALYGGDRELRLAQEIVLGVGGARVLHALGLAPAKFHLNEGHAAFAALELLRRSGAPTFEDRLQDVRSRCVFTTHTPVAAGHDRFPYPLAESALGPLVEPHELRQLAGADDLNMTELGLRTAGYANAVAARHGEVARGMFPGHTIAHVTNGVHPATWTSPSLRALYDEHLPGWSLEPSLLARAEHLPGRLVWEAHQAAKRDLIAAVESATGTQLREDVLTLGYARRATAYKRPGLLFSDLERLRRACHGAPLQIVFAGKAHPRDHEGKELIRAFFEHTRKLGDAVRCAYLPNYEMRTAAKLVAGVDVWLNTPEPPLEASGTSGMKAAFNGVPHFSVLDGWWVEGHAEGVTGWAIGPAPRAVTDDAERRRQELDDLYGKLEHVILPLYYDSADGWVSTMRSCVAGLAPFFNSHRMLRSYVTDAYFHTGTRS